MALLGVESLYSDQPLLQNSLQEAFDYLKADNAKTILAGVKKCQGFVSGLVGGEFKEAANSLFSNIGQALAIYWGKILEILLEKTEERTIIFQLYLFLLKVMYKLINKIFQQDMLNLIHEILSSSYLNSYILQPLLLKIPLCSFELSSFNAPHELSAAVSEGLYILCKLLEKAHSLKLPLKQFPELVEVTKNSTILAIEKVTLLCGQFSSSLLKQANLAAPPTVLAKTSLNLVALVAKHAQRVDQFYLVVCDKLQEIYQFCLSFFMIGEEDINTMNESACNYFIDMEDFLGGQTIGNIRSYSSEIIEKISQCVDPSVSQFTALAILNISKNLDLASDYGCDQIVNNQGLHKLLIKGADLSQSLSIVCANLIILSNMSHATCARDDLIKNIEAMLGDLLKKVSPDTNQLLVVYALQLYKQHLCDIFLEPEAFQSMVSFLSRYVCSSGNSFQTLPFLIATDLFETYFDLYEEQTSRKLSSLVELNAPQILAVLVTGIDRAEDQKFFSCIQKYVKVFRHKMKGILPADLSHIYSCLKNKMEKEILEVLGEPDGRELNIYDHAMLFSMGELIGDFFSSTKDLLSNFGPQIDDILYMVLSFISDSRVQTDSTFLEIVVTLLESHMSTDKKFSPCHIDFLGKYFLEKKLPRTLDDKVTYLLNSYMFHGFKTFPLELKDRFIIEIQMMVTYNLKKKQGRNLGFNGCLALFLVQSLLANMNEAMTRSQIQDMVSFGLKAFNESHPNSCILTSGFSTINAALVYCPVITIELLSSRGFLLEYVSLLNKKLISICLSPHDRRLLIFAIISLITHTLGVEAHKAIQQKALFRFSFLLLDYHLRLANSREGQEAMTPVNLLAFQTAEKQILELELVEGLEEDQTSDEPSQPNKTLYNPPKKRDFQDEDLEASNESSNSEDSLNSDYSDSDLMSSHSDDFGRYDSHQYKLLASKIDTPISQIDEYEAYRGFIKQLKLSSPDKLQELTADLTAEEKKVFFQLLFVQKMDIDLVRRMGVKKTPYRKIYKIKRTTQLGI